MQVDMILAPAGPGAINSIMQKNPKLMLDVALPGNSWSVAFNLNHKPFDNLKVRQAFMYAINKEDIRNFADPADAAGLRAQSAELSRRADRTELPEGTAVRLRSGHGQEAPGRGRLSRMASPSPRSAAQRDDYSSLMLIMRSSCARSASTWTSS